MAINAAVRSAEEDAHRARLARVGRMKGKAVAAFEALLQRHAQDTEFPDACFLRDCLAFSVFVGYDGVPPWYYDGLTRARSLFEENRIWHGMFSGESADVTLRSRARWGLLTGLATNDARKRDAAMTDLNQVLEIAGQASASVAAQCLLALPQLAMEGEPELEDVARYAVRFAEYCLQALGPEHSWSDYAAGYLELLRVQVPAARRGPRTPYAPSVTVWEGPPPGPSGAGGATR
jgi:hypothetical protein